MFRAPTAYMESVPVLKEPDWSDTGETVLIDIFPTGPGVLINYRQFPQEATSGFAYQGITNSLGVIDIADSYRLLWHNKQLKIKRIRDWSGFFVLDFDEVIGA